MQISGSSSGLSDYLAMMRQRRSQQSQGTGTGEEAKTASAAASYFTAVQTPAVSETSESATATEGASQGSPPAGGPSGAPPSGPPPGGGGGGMGGAGGATTTTSQTVSSVPGDTDGDGELSAEELAALLAEQETANLETEEAAPPPPPPPQDPTSELSQGYNATDSFLEARSNSNTLSYGNLFANADSNSGSSANAFMQGMIRSAYGA